jgi:hypothetical protein
MSLFKKLLILIIIIIFLYIVWQLIILHINLKKHFQLPIVENFKEGLSISSLFSSDQQSELNNMKSDIDIKLSSIIDNNKTKLTIKDFCIKSSYNTAVSGNYVSTDTLIYVINRGVRYLDFEVFYLDVSLNKSTIKEPVVSYTTDPTYVQLNTINFILLSDVLTKSVQNAFSSKSSTFKNFNDPLIINLRIKSNDKNVYSSVAKCIDNTIKQKLYSKKINKDTTLDKIMGKVIISFDINNYLYYDDYQKKSCSNNNNINSKDDCNNLLSKYINIENGGKDMNLLLYSYLIPKKTFIPNRDGTTNIDNIYVANPDSNYLKISKNNPDFGDWLLKYGCPIIPFQFHLNDSTLQDYEQFFNDNNSAFVPLADSITYFKKKISL